MKFTGRGDLVGRHAPQIPFAFDGVPIYRYSLMSATSTTSAPITPTQLPDAAGHFGAYGGVFVPETLMTALSDLTKAYDLPE